MKEICATCKYNKYNPDPNGFSNGEFFCNNEESEYYSVPTFYDDTCREEKK